MSEDAARFGEADDFFFESVAGFFEIDGEDEAGGGFVGDEGEDFVDAGDALAAEGGIEAAAGVELAKLVDGEVVEFAVAVGGAVERGVVEADEGAVFGAADVELEADAESEAGAKGGERAFRGGVKEAAVADDEGAGGLGGCGG